MRETGCQGRRGQTLIVVRQDLFPGKWRRRRSQGLAGEIDAALVMTSPFRRRFLFSSPQPCCNFPLKAADLFGSRLSGSQPVELSANKYIPAAGLVETAAILSAQPWVMWRQEGGKSSVSHTWPQRRFQLSAAV